MDGAVCIIEDDDDMRKLLSRVVCSAGLVARLYDSVISFSRRMDISPVACVLVEGQPSSFEGATSLEQLAEGALRCPVFLIGGTHDQVTAAAARGLNIIIIDKPFNVRLFAQAIRHAVSAPEL